MLNSLSGFTGLGVVLPLKQWSPDYGPRADSGPPPLFDRPPADIYKKNNHKNELFTFDEFPTPVMPEIAASVGRQRMRR